MHPHIVELCACIFPMHVDLEGDPLWRRGECPTPWHMQWLAGAHGGTGRPGEAPHPSLCPPKSSKITIFSSCTAPSSSPPDPSSVTALCSIPLLLLLRACWPPVSAASPTACAGALLPCLRDPVAVREEPCVVASACLSISCCCCTFWVLCAFCAAAAQSSSCRALGKVACSSRLRHTFLPCSPLMTCSWQNGLAGDCHRSSGCTLRLR